MKKPKNVKFGYLGEVVWVDSIASPGWQHTIEHTSLNVHSVGIIVGFNEKTITITTSVTAYMAIDSPLSIPWCAISKFRQHCRIVKEKGLTK
jgi:hypothetical protein